MKKELADREDDFRKDLHKKEQGFQTTLLGLFDHWEAKKEVWSKAERQIEEKEQMFRSELSNEMEKIKKDLQDFKRNLSERH